MKGPTLWLCIALAGAVGTLARFGLATAVGRATGIGFPWGTFVVNLAGCFLFGLVWALAAERGILGEPWRAVLLIGFMGAFTTFSTFGYETYALLRDGEWLRAAANAAGQMLGGLACLGLGIAAGRAA